MAYYEHPLPHHRHLLGIHRSTPAAALLPALLRGEECDAVEVVQGPPGTGKTRELVRRAALDPGRLLLCAPTNVGAANLYARCVAHGLGDAAALVMAADRVPPGTAVLCDSPRARVVCATVSARSGPALDGEAFDGVYVDEAALCMESWLWTLLRPEVVRLVLAGDVQQLPAIVSETGRPLRHERSLMERLVVDLDYGNTCRLTVQHRMAPELLAFPNTRFYGGALTCGVGAPATGVVEVHDVPGGTEEPLGTSWRNPAEADAAAALVRPGDVLLTPYLAQAELLLARKTGCEVHTIDSFQGREADTVVLSTVRDGTRGLGFWEDTRRLTVALTRARTRLVLVVSGVSGWGDGALAAAVRAAGP